VGSKNELFTTVDTTTRKLFITDTVFLLSDTVGFIKKLPTELIEGFESTLEQVALADLVLIVVDASDPLFQEKETSVRALLRKLQVQSPMVTIYNKIDLVPEGTILPAPEPDVLFTSTVTRQGLQELRDKLYEITECR
jgi:GTP-binding protein HflX